MSVIQATTRNVKTMADGTLRLSVDISPIHAQDAFSMFGMPDVPLALARLNIEATTALAQQETIDLDKPKGGFLSQWLALRCKEPDFREFILYKGFGTSDSEEDCDKTIKLFLGIESKTELDSKKEVEAKFHNMIRIPYSKWLAGAR